MNLSDLSTFQTVLWWSGTVVIYAVTLALVYRAGKTDGTRAGKQRITMEVLVTHLCAVLSCDGRELGVIIKAARETVGQECTDNPLDELIWGAMHIGLLQAEKERMK